MKRFTTLKSIPVYLPIANIDTDMIIPAQFLKTIKRTGLGKHLFFTMRYDESGNINNDFILNKSPFNQSKILIAGKNFGCGSSREHAPWALFEMGFKVIIAPSFADIFRNNCMQNGLLTITLDISMVDQIMANSIKENNYLIKVNLEEQSIQDDYGFTSEFNIDPFRKECLIEGFDDIDLSFKLQDKIEKFESNRISRW